MAVRTISQFYDYLAPDYDRMTWSEDRFNKELARLRQIFDKYRPNKILDAGSGTGFHSILMAELGANVTAVDISDAMLKQLRDNAERYHLDIKTVPASFLNLKRIIKDRFDAIFCLGNTLPHVRSAKELTKVLKIFHDLLNPGGILAVQILNYGPIISKKQRIQNVKYAEGKHFIRFYDFCGKRIYFNILTLDSSEGTIRHDLQTTILRPIMYRELKKAVLTARFHRVSSYGSLSLEKFRSSRSRDLVVIAGK
jgi:glycine/sarcosine N-methyltransferase